MTGARSNEVRAPYILALDLATTTGFCHGDGSKRPTLGHIVLPSVIDGDRGNLFNKLRWFVSDKIATARALGRDLMVIFEEPILPRPFIKNGQIIYSTKLETTLLLQGMAAIVEELCFELEVGCEVENVKKIKKALTGNGNAEKPQMVAAAEKMGFAIAVHDEADALACWLCALRAYNRQAAEKFDKLAYGSRGVLI